MLKQRVITAIVLLAVLLPALFAAQPLPLVLLVLLVVGAGGWEWARLNDLKGTAAIGTGAAVAALGALLFWLVTPLVPREHVSRRDMLRILAAEYDETD